MIRMASPASSGRLATDPAAMVPTTGSETGDCLVAPMASAALMANPVHGCIGERRNGFVGHHRLGQHQAKGFGQGRVGGRRTVRSRFTFAWASSSGIIPYRLTTNDAAHLG